MIKDLFEQDDTLWDRTVLSVQNIIALLGFCLHNTYFSFPKKFYEQVEGAPVGSLVSPFVANLYMNIWREKLYDVPPPLPDIGSGMWMAPLSFYNRPTNKYFWII